jgi:hypothetical protein
MVLLYKELSMRNFRGQFEKLHEQTLYRCQQGGFLRGDYVTIKSNALHHDLVKGLSDQMKTVLNDAIQNDTVLRVSYIKSGRSEAFSGPVDAANIPSCELWADCYVEHAPGMWHNVMTVPCGILEKIEIEGANGFPPYNKNLIRPNTKEPGSADSELKTQTKGDDVNRNLTRKNIKIKESHFPGKENDLIFESYTKTLNELYYYNIYIIQGYNERGPWKTEPIKSYPFSGDFKQDIKKIIETDTPWAINELRTTYKDDQSVVLSIPAEATIVASLDPKRAEELYDKYNEDTADHFD